MFHNPQSKDSGNIFSPKFKGRKLVISQGTSPVRRGDRSQTNKPATSLQPYTLPDLDNISDDKNEIRHITLNGMNADLQTPMTFQDLDFVGIPQ